MVPAELDQIARRVREGQSATTTVRTLLSWFRAQRRGSATVWTIKRALRELGLVTSPSFENAWIDAEIAFRQADHEAASLPGVFTPEPSTPAPPEPGPSPPAPTDSDVSTPVVPLPGVSTAGLPTPGLPTPDLSTAGLPTPGLPTPGLPTAGLPTPGLPPPAVSLPSVSLAGRAGPAVSLPTPPPTAVVPMASPSGPGMGPGQADPVHRVGKLPAANNAPAWVTPGTDIAKATTQMLLHDLSQVPVAQSQYAIRGVVSWRSIGRHTALHGPPRVVDDCLEEAPLCSSEASVFEVAHLVHRHGYVLVRSPERKLQGLVTARDLSEQFGLLLEPFLLIGEAEGHLRGLIEDHIPLALIQAARDPADTGRKVEGAADLTFGEYKRLLEQEKHWSLLGVTLDRSQVIEALDELRKARNDLMHFSPEGLDDAQLRSIRELALLLRELRRDTGRE